MPSIFFLSEIFWEQLAAQVELFVLGGLALVAIGTLLAALSVFAHYHIIDPRSGHSSPELASVSVSAPTVVMADGLATAVMVVMGQAGLELVEQLSACEAYAVTKDARTVKTSGFQIN